MRFFIALEITNENKLQLQSIAQKVGKIIPQAKLADPDKYHLTLAFIGDQPDTLKERLIETMSKAADKIPPFSVVPAYIDGFPHLHNSKVIWVGVNGDIDRLIVLQQRIQTQLADLNLPIDNRPFTPHITIAKQNSLEIDPQKQEKLQEIMQDNFDLIKISSIKLFESVPEIGFHTHRTLAEIQLG
jgi:2'-5' RNA ligase